MKFFLTCMSFLYHCVCLLDFKYISVGLTTTAEQMANDTRSSRKAKDDGYTNERQINEKGRINSGSCVAGTAGLRRSARETSSKMIASSSSTQKSEQLEKRTPPTLAVRRSP